MSDNQQKHSGPWACPLWDHVDEIRSLRMARKSWEEVSVQMEKHDIRLKARAIRNFFLRATDPNLKLPLGLEHLKKRYDTEFNHRVPQKKERKFFVVKQEQPLLAKFKEATD
jgi:hypothetical protein